MAERDYSHRDVVDKLGVKPGAAVAFDSAGWPVDPELRQRVLELSGTASTIDVPIREEMVPNVFVGVLLVRERVEKGGGEPGDDPGRPPQWDAVVPRPPGSRRLSAPCPFAAPAQSGALKARKNLTQRRRGLKSLLLCASAPLRENMNHV